MVQLGLAAPTVVTVARPLALVAKGAAVDLLPPETLALPTVGTLLIWVVASPTLLALRRVGMVDPVTVGLPLAATAVTLTKDVTRAMGIFLLGIMCSAKFWECGSLGFCIKNFVRGLDELYMYCLILGSHQ